MNQTELQNAAHKIDGYYNPPKNASDVPSSFDNAKAMTLFHLRQQLAHVEAITVDAFLKNRR